MDELKYVFRIYYHILFWIVLVFLVVVALVHAVDTIDFILADNERRMNWGLSQPCPDDVKGWSKKYINYGKFTCAFYVGLAFCLIISRIPKRNLREYAALFFVLCVFLLLWLLKPTNSMLENL